MSEAAGGGGAAACWNPCRARCAAVVVPRRRRMDAQQERESRESRTQSHAAPVWLHVRPSFSDLLRMLWQIPPSQASHAARAKVTRRGLTNNCGRHSRTQRGGRSPAAGGARTKSMAGAGEASKRGYSAAAAAAVDRRAGAAAGISACRDRAASLATGRRRLADAPICAQPVRSCRPSPGIQPPDYSA